MDFVRDAGGLGDNFADAAEITLSQASILTFSLIAPTSNAFGGTLSFDASIPDQTNTSTSEYTLSVSAVPLPAAGLMLLMGLAGAAGLKRRKKHVA